MAAVGPAGGATGLMAVCLGCGSNAARVVHSRSAVVVREEGSVTVVSRVCRRIVSCSACGEYRAQIIEDEGLTRRRWIPPEEDIPTRR